MAKWSVQPVLTLIYLACAAALVVPGFGSFAQAPEAQALTIDFKLPGAQAPTIDLGLVPSDPHQGLPPEPQPGFYNFVDSCIAKITPECGKEIFDGLFENQTISNTCCHNLVEMGKPCHYAFIRTLASIDNYKQLAPQLARRGEEIWEECNNH